MLQVQAIGRPSFFLSLFLFVAFLGKAPEVVFWPPHSPTSKPTQIPTLVTVAELKVANTQSNLQKQNRCFHFTNEKAEEEPSTRAGGWLSGSRHQTEA